MAKSKDKKTLGSTATASDPQKVEIKAVDFQCGW